MRAVADKYGWAFLELNWMLDKYKRSELTVHRRDCHPNAFANELVSKAIMETFMQERLLSDSLAEQ